jgi:hypothetical protein
MGWTTGFRFFAGAEKGFFFSSPLGPTQPLIQWVPRVNRPGREAEYALPSDAEGKNAWSCTSTHSCVFMTLCLIKQVIYLNGVVVN